MDKKLIAGNFSKSAKSYDNFSPVQKRCAQHLAELIGEGDFGRVLEIGCGTGALTELLREKWRKAEITAVDISEDMVNVSRGRLEDDRTRFLVADGEDLDIAGEVDLITSNASFQWFEGLDRAFERFSQGLTSGGVFCFSMYGPGTFRELRHVLEKYYGSRKWLSSSKFVSRSRVERMLNRHFSRFSLKEEYLTVYFHSLWDLLRDIKHSGTRGEGLGGSVFLGKYAINEMEKGYIEKFGRIVATHHIYFCRAEK